MAVKRADGASAVPAITQPTSQPAGKTAAASVPADQLSKLPEYYTVAAGETVNSIVAKYQAQGLTLDELKKLNPNIFTNSADRRADGSLIYPGDLLQLRAASTAPDPSNLTSAVAKAKAASQAMDKPKAKEPGKPADKGDPVARAKKDLDAVYAQAQQLDPTAPDYEAQIAPLRKQALANMEKIPNSDPEYAQYLAEFTSVYGESRDPVIGGVRHVRGAWDTAVHVVAKGAEVGGKSLGDAATDALLTPVAGAAALLGGATAVGVMGLGAAYAGLGYLADGLFGGHGNEDRGKAVAGFGLGIGSLTEQAISHLPWNPFGNPLK